MSTFNSCTLHCKLLEDKLNHMMKKLDYAYFEKQYGNNTTLDVHISQINKVYIQLKHVYDKRCSLHVKLVCATSIIGYVDRITSFIMC